MPEPEEWWEVQRAVIHSIENLYVDQKVTVDAVQLLLEGDENMPADDFAGAVHEMVGVQSRSVDEKRHIYAWGAGHTIHEVLVTVGGGAGAGVLAQGLVASLQGLRRPSTEAPQCGGCRTQR